MKLFKISANRVFLVLMGMFAFLMRSVSIMQEFATGAHFYFSQSDTYYHLRRAMIFAKNFPRIITIDNYMAYPYGAEAPWPPLYDWLIALAALLFGRGTATIEMIELVTKFVNPLLAALCVIPVYKITKLLWDNEHISFLAVLMFIITPGMLWNSHSGDHHVAEIFCAIWFYYFSLKALRSALNREAYADSSLKAGLWVALGLLTWQGQVLYYSIWFMYVALLMFRHRSEANTLRDVALSGLISGVTGSAIAAAVRFIIPSGTEQTLFSYSFFSYFQPVYTALLFTLPWMAYILMTCRRKFLASAGMLVILLFPLLFTPLGTQVMQGMQFIFQASRFRAEIDEARSPISALNLLLPRHAVYLALSIVPIVLGIMLLKRSFGKRQEQARQNEISIILFFAVSVIAFGAMYLQQKRWLTSYSLFFSMGLAYAIQRGYQKFIAAYSRWSWKHAKDRVVVNIAVVSFCMLTGGLFIQNYFFYRGMQSILPVNEELMKTFAWIKRSTPPTSGLWDPEIKPEYSVLAFWDKGHYIQYLAERPSVTNNFETELRGNGFRDMPYAWSLRDENELLNICHKYGVKFIIVEEPVPYLFGSLSGYIAPALRNDMSRNNFFTMALARLMEFDGTQTAYGPALCHFRLVYESGQKMMLGYHANAVSEYKVYELVKGARITGKAPGKAPVVIQSKFISPVGREFEWKTTVTPDATGAFSATLPYATGGMNYSVRPLLPYTVFSGSKKIVFHASNDSTVRGDNFMLNFVKNRIQKDQ